MGWRVESSKVRPARMSQLTFSCAAHESWDDLLLLVLMSFDMMQVKSIGHVSDGGGNDDLQVEVRLSAGSRPLVVSHFRALQPLDQSLVVAVNLVFGHCCELESLPGAVMEEKP